MTVKEFVNWIYPQAELVKDLSPLFVTAQAALESGWGKAAIGNNLFGITKGSTWKGETKLVTTTEYFSSPSIRFESPEKVISVTRVKPNCYKYKVKRLFRMYDSVAECLRDHLAILKKPQFADAWPDRYDPRKYVVKLQDSVGLRYATAPDYVSTINKIYTMIEAVLKNNKK